ncbi:MAG: ABC transporter permease [Planctomycetota bacterium]|jgi:oligopeptide transport system permease protein
MSPGASHVPAADKGTSLWADAWRRLKRNKLAIGGGLTLVLMVLATFVLPAALGLDPQKTTPANKFQGPSAEHPFGTDNLGRDYFARVLVGGRTSLLVGLAATLASVVIGVIYGAIAGYYGGKTDEVMMRIVDFLYAIPYMFLVILITLQFSKGAKGDALPVFVGLGMVQWLTMARIVRGEVLTLRDREFVQAARVTGAGDGRIIFRHILPNILGTVVIYATLTVPAVIILESFLSYLGLGVELSWGRLVSEAVGVVNPIESHIGLLLWPSLFLALTLFSLNFLGDGLRDALDPRTRR